jgi:ATP-dependent DNA ligase
MCQYQKRWICVSPFPESKPWPPRILSWHSNRTSVRVWPGQATPKRNEVCGTDAGESSEGIARRSKLAVRGKLDGCRALAIKNKSAVRLLSRRNNVLNDRFPFIVAALENLEDGLILDGEIVALDAEGRPSFNLLEQHKGNAEGVVFYLFDLLAFRGRDVGELPLRQRRELLDEVLASPREPLRASVVLNAALKDLIPAIKSLGLEGIVAKRSDSRYESGERSGQWVKFRVNKGQELIIGGYRPGKTYFDNLAVGYYEDAGRLIFIAKIKNGSRPTLRSRSSVDCTTFTRRSVLLITYPNRRLRGAVKR